MREEPTRDARVTIGTIGKVMLWFIYVWVLINLIILFLAFTLLLFGANPQAEFAQWVYRSAQRTMAPFRGLFEPVQISDKSVLDTSLLFAMIIYGLVALFLKAAIDWVTDHINRRRRRLAEEERAAQLAAAQSTSPPVSARATPSPATAPAAQPPTAPRTTDQLPPPTRSQP
jgi:hypothetical protein